MVHKQRAFQITDVATFRELAQRLRWHTWSGCNGFRKEDWLFLNDSFSPDGAQEYAVLWVGKGPVPKKAGPLQPVSDTVVTAKSVADLLAALGPGAREIGTAKVVPESPLDVLTRSVADAIELYDRSGDHTRHSSTVRDCIRCRLAETIRPAPAKNEVVGVQVESLTVSWYESDEQLLEELQRITLGERLSDLGRLVIKLHGPHEQCGFCR
jgi:hypothetical protein